MKKLIISLLVLLPLLNTHNSYSQVFPGEDWESNENAIEEGWNEEKGRELFRYLRDSSVITGFMVVHKGKVVYEYGDLEEMGYIASCRKSILAMLYGEYVESGTIDLQKTVGEMGMDDVKGLMEIEKKATIQNLITARSGVYHPEGYAGGWQEYAPDRGSVQPGSYWLYNNWDFNSAGYVFEQETGKNIYDEVERQLAIPLGFQDWNREIQHKQGNTDLSMYLAYPMWISTRDLARIGLLMLNNGDWNGKKVISKSWIGEMLKERTTSEEINKNAPAFRYSPVQYGYGYMWWLWANEKDPRFQGAYSALGAMGQTITVYPAVDVVLAYKTKETYRRVNSGLVRQKLLRKAVEMFDGN